MAVITIDMSRDTQIREKARLREKALHDEEIERVLKQ